MHGEVKYDLMLCTPIVWLKIIERHIETSNVNAVMDGDIEKFINGYLIWLTSMK
jgi:hypothetical protein